MIQEMSKMSFTGDEGDLEGGLSYLKINQKNVSNSGAYESMKLQIQAICLQPILENGSYNSYKTTASVTTLH